MTLALLLGCGLGLGLCLLAAGLAPAPPSLARTLHRHDSLAARAGRVPPGRWC